MADVTISQLTQGTPAGNSLLPYSTGSNTLGAPVSAIFQKTSKVYFNSSNDSVTSFQHLITAATSASFIMADDANKDYLGSDGSDLNTKNAPLLELRGTSFNFSEPRINFTEKGSVMGSIIVKNYVGNTGTFHFCTNNTQFAVNSAVPRMTISSSGVVTKPFQPAFAVKAETQTLNILNLGELTNYPKISFPRVILNNGNYYNAANSEFTAPVAGVYSFSGMLRLDTLPTHYMYPMVMINGVGYIETTKSGDSQGALPGLMHNISSSLGGTAVATNWHQLIALNAGDKITLGFGASDNKNYIIDNQSVFYGYLLG